MLNSFADIKKMFSFNLNKLLDEIIKKQDVKEVMIDLNQQQLSDDGTDALGQTIVTIGGSPYRVHTIRIKREKGQPTNKVTLYDTGGFYKTFRVVITRDGYQITANFNKKDGSILDNFSSQFDFLGLDDERLAQFAIEILLPRLQNVLLKKYFTH